MKNLFAIPRRFLFVVFTILITLVVCLAGFTEAEEQRGKQKIKKEKEDFLQKRSPPEEDPSQIFNLNGDQLAKSSLQESSPDYSLKNSLNYFLEPNGFVNEKDGDGYGYDDDEMYHFNYKRNNQESYKLDDKEEKDKYKISNKDENGSNKNMADQKQKDETETIEMLDFKESHPNVNDIENRHNLSNKPFSYEVPGQKLSHSNIKDSLKMSDLKSNPAIGENMKDRKKESGGTLSSKASETKVTGEIGKSGSVKLKESKVDESEKKDKMASLKDSKESGSFKNLECAISGSREKEKNIKLQSSVKLVDTGKKETDTAKVTKENKEGVSCIEKEKAEGMNQEETKEKASLVSDDAMKKTNAQKSKVSDEDERSLGYEQFAGLTDYEDLRDRKESVREESPRNVDYTRGMDRELEYVRGSPGINDYYPVNYELNGMRDYNNKRESWNQPEKSQTSNDVSASQEYNVQQQLLELKKLQEQIQQDQQQQELNSQGRFMQFGDFENTDYRKNYLKSLKKYKTIEDDIAKRTNTDTNVKNPIEGKPSSTSLNKRSKTKRKSPENEKVEEGNEKLEKEKNPIGLAKLADDGKFHKTDSGVEPENDDKAETSMKEPRNASAKVGNEVKSSAQNQERFSNVKERSKKHMAKSNPTSEKKFKRKAAVWKRTASHDESFIKTRGVPAGYYTNRVQLGQKHGDHAEVRSSGEASRSPPSYVVSSNEAEHLINGPNKNRLQPMWESRVQNYQHYSQKRHENGLKKARSDNSLFLVKKDSNGLIPSLKTLADLNKKKNSEPNMASYFVIEKDPNFLQRFNPPNGFQYAYQDLRNSEQKQAKTDDNQKFARSPYSNQGYGNYELDFSNSEEKSNLRKGFDKFRELADLLKDREQGSREDQHTAQELKEGENFVFSQEKLLDPIVINGDVKENFKLKPKNSMYSISKNFRQLDQESKNEGGNDQGQNLISNLGYKIESVDTGIEPGLKNAFPEAKSINTIRRNGHEIVLINFDSNKIKTHTPQPVLQDESKYLMVSDEQPVGVILGNHNEGQNDGYGKQINDNNYNKMESGGNAVHNMASYPPRLAVPLNMLAQQLVAQQQYPFTQKDAKLQQLLKLYQYQKQLPQRSGNYMKRNINYIYKTLPSSSIAELSTFGDANIRYLENILKSFANNDQMAVKNEKQSGDWAGISENSNPAVHELRSTMTHPFNERQKEYQILIDDDKPLALLQSSEGELPLKVVRLRREGMKKLEKSDESVKGHVGKEESSERGKSEYDAHLNEMFENLKKNQKEQMYKENGVNRRRRSHANRRKRSPQSSSQNKVSTNKVQNKILSKLAEDNYQSVYSSGIKRKLLSIEHEEEDCDEHFEQGKEDSPKAQPNYDKNQNKNSIHPLILQLFSPERDEKYRERRSLSPAFHTNFKREIDLGESMPNDFQSFLETSLGGLGSQKREIIKKSDASWDERENDPDSANQIAENSPGGKTSGEDSPLEKREVSNAENHKQQRNGKSLIKGQERSLKKGRSQELQGKSNEYNDDKVPTKIRIQITNASAKEKKSSKSVMDESDTTSTEMENPPPKEKEFLDKNKFGVGSSQKLRQLSKNKFSYPEYRGKPNLDDHADILYAARPPFRHGRRKKKKYITEDPQKPLKEFMEFDKKAMETLLKKYLEEQTMMGNTGQKFPVINHLPQVETVYNPTQGTNKAQVEGYKISKANSIGNKNSVKEQSHLSGKDEIDEKMTRPNLGEKSKLKLKDLDSKSLSESSNGRQDMGQILQNLKLPEVEAPGDSPEETSPINRYLNNYMNQMKWPEVIYGNNFINQPSLETDRSPNFLGDSGKLQKEWDRTIGFLRDRPGKSDVKSAPENVREKLFGSDVEDSWVAIDSLRGQEGLPQKYKSKDYFISTLRKHPELVQKLAYNSYNDYFLKNLYDKIMSNSRDVSKDAEYVDDDEYADDDVNKDLSLDYPLISEPVKNFKTYDGLNFRNLKTDLENGNEYDEDVNDDYEESSDDEDLDDYSMVSVPIEPELRQYDAYEKFHGDIFHPVVNSFYYPNPFRLKDSEKVQFENLKPDDAIERQEQHGELTDGNFNADPSWGSTAVLKNANKNGNIFEKNLIKNLNRFDDAWLKEDHRKTRNLYPSHGKRMEKRKYAQDEEKRYPLLGNRFFYAIKKDRGDNRELLKFPQRRQTLRNLKYVHHVPRKNPLDAQLRPEDSSEYDSDEGERLQSGLNNINGENQKDVQESLEDDGEAVSTDNYAKEKGGPHVVRKRSVNEEEEYEFDVPKVKVIQKRLSPGHLAAENNFKKFHRKNLTGKRQTLESVDGVDFSEKYSKRSPLVMWKKLTNKDKEVKKIVMEDMKDVGFEPLVALEDQKQNNRKGVEESESGQRKLSSDVESQMVFQNRNKNLEGQLKTFQASLNRQEEGPWKIELNEKYDIKYVQPELGNLPMLNAINPNWGKENVKAYFMKSASGKNARAARAEVAGEEEEPKKVDGYQTDEGGGQLKKRSLEPDAAATSTDGQSEEKGRKEREQKTKASRDAQRRSDDDGGFVNPERQAKKLKEKFLSNGKSVSKKSIFPPSSDSNIFRDNRLLNEETSEESGQRIVDAILSHASSNPKFKTLIAPGLNKRTPEFQEEAKGARVGDSSDTMQNQLQKIMLNLEELAEKNVKTRMCNKIDDKSKKFLKSLISTPSRKLEAAELVPGCESCGSKEVFQRSEPLESRPSNNEHNIPLRRCEDLKRKRDFLKKRLYDFNGSSMERGNYNAKYRQILQELDEADQMLGSARCKPSKSWPPFPDSPARRPPSPFRCPAPFLSPSRPCCSRPRPSPLPSPCPSLYDNSCSDSCPCPCPCSSPCPFPSPPPCSLPSSNPCPLPSPCPCPCPIPSPCPCPLPPPCPCPIPPPCPCPIPSPNPCPLPPPCPCPLPIPCPCPPPNPCPNPSPPPCPCPYPIRCPLPKHPPCPKPSPCPDPLPRHFPEPCPAPCPEPFPRPCPRPCPEPFPRPCPEPFPRPCPDLPPRPNPCPCPEPRPRPCPRPCPEPLPRPCPRPSPNSVPHPFPCPCKPCKPPVCQPECKPRRPAFPPYNKYHLNSFAKTAGKDDIFSHKKGIEKVQDFVYSMPSTNTASSNHHPNEYNPHSQNDKKNRMGTWLGVPESRQEQFNSQQSRRETANGRPFYRETQNMIHFEPSKEEQLRIQKEGLSATTDSLPPLYERVQSVNLKSEAGGGGSSVTRTSDESNISPDQLPDTTQGPLRGRQKASPGQEGNSANAKDENTQAKNTLYPYGSSKSNALFNKKGESAGNYLPGKNEQKLNEAETSPSSMRHKTESKFTIPIRFRSTQEGNLNYRNNAILPKINIGGVSEDRLKENNPSYILKGPFFHEAEKNFHPKTPSEQTLDEEHSPRNYEQQYSPEKTFEKPQNAQLNRQKRFFNLMNRRREEKLLKEGEKEERDDGRVEDYPDMDYFMWSSMPAVRRNLNRLALSVDPLDKSSKRLRQVDKNP